MNTEPETAVERDDSIHIDLFSDSFKAIEELSERAGWPILSVYMQPCDLLLLIERLKKTVDSPRNFPRGKWATIQRLEYLFNEGFWL